MPTLLALGPGIVVAGSVMGSGELINTPVQAAKFGFVLLWAVILSCLIKYFLQVEIARHCLVHNRTTVEGLNLCPGPRFRGTSWVGFVYMLGYTISLITLVGIVGAIAGMLHAILPLADAADTSRKLWGFLTLLLTQALLWRSLYGSLEKLVTVMVAGFSLSVVLGVVLIQGTEHQIKLSEITSGFTFSLGDHPELAAFAVISLLGALGTTANELFMYPYWVLEKGYGKSVGSPDSAGWTERARGWVRVLKVDAGVATGLATVVTAAYFLLGAAIFGRENRVPEGADVVDEMSAIYTSTYGAWSYTIFAAGAFCTLFSTLIVATAATGRMWAYILSSVGAIDRDNNRSMRRCHQVAQSSYLILMLVVLLTLREPPAKLVILGQYFSGLFNTPLLIFGICWMAFHTDPRLRMRRPTAVLLMISVVVILVCVVAGFAIQKKWIG